MSTDDARSRLLAAAGPIFAEKGFKTATVREICQAATVNVASVNYYFGDKERLYVEAVKRAHPLYGAPQPTPPLWSAETPAPEKLAKYLRTTVTHMLGVKSEAWQSQLLTREIMNPSAACRELVEEFFRHRFNLLLEILDEILPASTPAHRRHLIALSIVAQFVYFRAGRNVIEMIVGEEEVREHHRTEQVAEHIIHASFAMLGLGPAVGEVVASDGGELRGQASGEGSQQGVDAQQFNEAEHGPSSVKLTEAIATDGNS